MIKYANIKFSDVLFTVDEILQVVPVKRKHLKTKFRHKEEKIAFENLFTRELFMEAYWLLNYGLERVKL